MGARVRTPLDPNSCETTRLRRSSSTTTVLEVEDFLADDDRARDGGKDEAVLSLLVATSIQPTMHFSSPPSVDASWVPRERVSA